MIDTTATRFNDNSTATPEYSYVKYIRIDPSDEWVTIHVSTKESRIRDARREMNRRLAKL